MRMIVIMHITSETCCLDFHLLLFNNFGEYIIRVISTGERRVIENNLLFTLGVRLTLNFLMSGI